MKSALREPGTSSHTELRVIEPHFPRPGGLAVESSQRGPAEIMNEETCLQRSLAPALLAVLELNAGQPDLLLGAPPHPGPGTAREARWQALAGPGPGLSSLRLPSPTPAGTCSPSQ